MALMYPRQLKADKELEAAGLSPISAAERQLFDLFKKHLGDDYSVFHGVVLQVPRKGGGINDREIDFLIAHPDYGLLTIEVKGGLIRIDGAKGQWTSKDRYGEIHEIKDPFEQIRQACYDLNRSLQRNDALKGFDYTTWYAVSLPDVDVDEDLGLGAPRAIVLDRCDVHPDRIEAAIKRIFQYYKRKEQLLLGKRGVKALTRKMVPDWFLRSHLATDFEHEEDQFNQLTVQQYAVLEFIEEKPRAMIAGCAGSGKTMLAVEKARRLSGQGKRVLFTCYNKNLAEWLQEKYAFENVTFQHFHSLAKTVAKEAGKPIPWITDLGVSDDDYWSRVVPERLFDVASTLPASKRYDAVIVDEGQDFRDTYWEAVQMLLKDPSAGTLYIFYDDSQRLYSHDKFPLPEPAGRLNRNLRSTHEIGQKVVEYYRGIGTIYPAGPETGRPIEMVSQSKYKSLPDALADVLAMLDDEKVKPCDIALLTPLAEDKSIWKHKMTVGSFELVREGKLKGKRILTSTVHSFKGLERSVIILSEFERGASEEELQLLYVAVSRARNHLIVLGYLPEAQKASK